MPMERIAAQMPGLALRCVRPASPHRFTATALRRRHNIQRRHKATNSSGDHQATPLTGYYADILATSTKGKQDDADGKDVLDKPLEEVQPVTRTAPERPLAESLPKTDKEERVEKAQIIFGSRLAGPQERRDQIDAASQDVAGIVVPPKPEEPENCCMSGCVNCVWDVYRDDLEEWATKSAAARERIQAQSTSGQASGTTSAAPDMPSNVAVSMDDDGGGSAANWESGLELSGKEGDLFGGIPVGIREFMRTEKNLKQKHSGGKGPGPNP